MEFYKFSQIGLFPTEVSSKLQDFGSKIESDIRQDIINEMKINSGLKNLSSLGKRSEFNKTLNSIKYIDDICIFKSTTHYNQFIHRFIFNIIIEDVSNVFILICNEELNHTHKLFDSTSLNKSKLEQYLILLVKILKNNHLPTIYVGEINKINYSKEYIYTRSDSRTQIKEI